MACCPQPCPCRCWAPRETLIGLALITGLLLRPALTLLFAHMAGVFTSLALLPGQMWHHGVPTLEGQYVLKNVILVAACLTVTADELTR
ncbi:DoxX family protein OS=Streptomyces glaucescens OX=1907 GN=SGLAU_31795 PE=4 SV=1 [Streptomyces glaucescens]